MQEGSDGVEESDVDDGRRPPRSLAWRLAQVVLIAVSLGATGLLVDFLATWVEAEQIRNGPHGNLVERMEQAGVIGRPRPGMHLASHDGTRAAHAEATPKELERAEARLRDRLGEPFTVSREGLRELSERGFTRAGFALAMCPTAKDVVAFQWGHGPRSPGSAAYYELYLLSRDQRGWWVLIHGDEELHERLQPAPAPR